MQGFLVVFIAVAYVTLLFGIASLGDRWSARRDPARTRPYIYALSLAIYCTSWTFFGSVGLATERSFEFLAIYIGPVLVFLFGFPLLKRIIELAKSEKITSIADFLGARYGKSSAVACIATLIAVVGTVPYIALQLKAISGSVSLMIGHYSGAPFNFDPFVSDISLVIAMLLALFAILFGTRHADATEHQDGLVLAIAVESVVKLAAFLAVGIFVTFFLFDSPERLVEALSADSRVQASFDYRTSLGTWLVMTALSGFAIVMLPRQFYVMIVENRAESELRTATWVFPLYLFAINLFVLPVALAGLVLVGGATSSDLYVVSLPLLTGHDVLAMVAFVGGLSAATAMVIVASVALSIMVSNDLVIPLFVRRRLLKGRPAENGDWSSLILNIRRASIFMILFVAFLYYRESTNNARLASIGLMSFAAVAQFAPAFLGGLIWRGANARGAALGMLAGIAVWTYTLLLPSLAAPDTGILDDGPFGIEALHPQALFGTEADPLVHGVIWSLSINLIFFVLGSLSRASVPLERIQAAIFVPRDSGPLPSLKRFRSTITVNDLKDTISRYLGVERTERSFQSFEAKNGALNGNEQAGMDAIRFSEQLLASAVGSSSARLILSLLFKRGDSASTDTFRLLDDATEALQQNRDLLQIALDQMEQGITVFDRDFRLTCWNRQYRLLFDLPDEMGQVGVSLNHILNYLARRGDIAPDMQVAILGRMTTFGTPWQMELKTSGRIIELRSNPMPDGGIVATYADITQSVEADLALKRANESLEQRVARRTAELTRVNEELAQAQMFAEEANLGKTRFLAAAGHDILQPLNAARLYCSSLIEKAGRGPTGDAAANIESSLESVETILGAVLDISRLDAGAMKPVESVFQLDGLLRQIGTDFQPLAAAKKLELNIVPSSVAVHTDRNLLRRLIQNLVSNAVKYTRTGRILVGARRRGGLVEIQVFDTGIGIPVDKLSSVFGEFTRLEEGAREAQGLGLGLSIVDRIARVLRLELQVDSGRGAGTRFSVVLPVSDAVEPPATAEAAPALQPETALNGMTVLCIDNDLRILEGMRLLFEGWGCTVVTHSGSKSIEHAGRLLTPDIILADYHLDGETGLDMIRRLRARFGEATPAVLVTADRSNEVREAADQMDVSVINKPLKPAVLRSLMTRLRRMTPAAAE